MLVIMDFEDVTCICALALRIKKSKRRKKKQYWVHPDVSNRLCKGQFYTLYAALRNNPTKFYDYFQMSINSYDKLLHLIKRTITYKDTNMRKSVPPEERLAVTLRYLSTGTSFVNIRQEYLLGVSTIREIVRDTCHAIVKCVKPLELREKSVEDWLSDADEFFKMTKFPNCIATAGAKYVRIKKCDNSAPCFDHKKYSSVILMAFVDPKCCFSAVDVGAFGLNDSNAFKDSNIGKKFLSGEMNFPHDRHLPNDEKGISMPFVVAGSEAFALSEHMLRAFTGRHTNPQNTNFNQHLAKATQIMETAFRVLTNKWKIFQNPLNVRLEFCDILIKTCCILHNFVIHHDGMKCEDTLYHSTMDAIEPFGIRGTAKGRDVRKYFATYFSSSQ